MLFMAQIFELVFVEDGRCRVFSKVRQKFKSEIKCAEKKQAENTLNCLRSQ